MLKDTQPLDYHHVRRLIALGDLDRVLHLLIAYVEGTEAHITTDVYLTSARFHKLALEKQRGEIANQDYSREFNAITHSLLEIVEGLKEVDPHYFQEVPSQQVVQKEIEALALEFHEAFEIGSPLSRLRTQIHIARRMAEKMMLWPILLKGYKHTEDEAIMCAIGRKIKAVADIEDLEILEAIIPRARTNMTKGFLTNALAELIYSGQLRVGDDLRVKELCYILAKEGDMVLLTNVDRVIAMVDFMNGSSGGA